MSSSLIPLVFIIIIIIIIINLMSLRYVAKRIVYF